MNFVENFPMFTIVLSLFSGVLCTMLKGKTARHYTVTYECVLLFEVVCVLVHTLKIGTSFTYVMGEFPAPWGNEIRAGVLEALTALVFLIVLLCSVLGGARFVDIDVDESKVNYYYALINLMTAAILSLVWTNDIFTGYVFLEILTLTSCGILIVREIGRTTLAAIRYMIMNLLGSGLFLLGVVLLYDISGNLLMVPMHEEISILVENPENITVVTMAVGVLTVGLAIKGGLFPFHMWMPDTYSWATPTSGAILSSIVSKCYIFLLLKIYYRCIGIDTFELMPVRNILFVLGVLGMILGSVSALHAESINRMLAFSSVAQIGYIFAGIGFGGRNGYMAALYMLMAHSVTKSQLFLTTPRLAEASHDSLLFKNLQGSALRNKNAGVFFTVGALSMIGIPIFAGFAAKLQLSIAVVDTGSTAKIVIFMLAIALSSVLNALYFIRTLIRIYTPLPGSGGIVTKKHHLNYSLSMVLLLALNLAMGLASGTFADLILQGLDMFG